MKTFPNFLKTVLGTLLLLLATHDSRANNITISTTTNWSAITSGSGTGGQPGASDNITITSGAFLKVNVTNGVCASIIIGNASTSGILYFNPSGDPAITVSGSITIGVGSSGGNMNMTSGILTVGSLITNSNSVLQYGYGRIIITTASTVGSSPNANSFWNLEILNGGTFSAGANITVGDSLIVGTGTTLDLGSNNMTGPDYLFLNNNTTITGSGTLSEGGIIFSLGTTSTINCPMVIYSTTTNIVTGGTLTIHGIISNVNGDLTVNSPTSYTGTLALTALNTYGYGTEIYAGTVLVSADGNLGATGYGINVYGGTLSVSNSFTMNSGRALSMIGSNCFINVSPGQTLVCPNSISGGGTGSGYSLIGGGTLTLSGTNNFSGTLTVSSGQLNINNGNSASGTLALDAGVTLDNTSGSPVTVGSNFTGLTINGNFTFGGSNFLSFSTDPISLNASPTITLNNVYTLTLGGTINSPTQSITTAGTGALNFSNAVQLNSLTLGNSLFVSSAGNLSLKGSLTNNGAFFDHNLGSVIFNGTSPQSISGSTGCGFNNLSLSNTSGLTINTPEQVNNSLNFSSNGHITVNSTLLLSSSASIVSAGTNAYLVTGTGGKISRVFPATGTFNFPVGDNAAGSDYTPISVHMLSATFPDTVGVFCTNGKDANNHSATNYLNRYWTLSQSLSGTISATLQGSYLSTDVAGTESQITTGLWSGSQWKSYGLVDAVHHQVNATVTSFGDITGIDAPLVSIAAGSGCLANSNITGGATPFTYLWNNSATSSSVALTTSGIYAVTVTDANGFAGTASSNLTIVSAATGVLGNVTCYGGSNGNGQANASGGLSPYTYSWSNGTSTLSTSNPTGGILSAGTYTVFVTDNLGCMATAGVTITQSPLLIVSTAALNNPLCYGTSTGNLSANPTGATSPYTYSWSNGTSAVSTSNPTGNILPSGNYTVTVTDKYGCSGSSLATLTQPALLTATTRVISNISCYGGNNGNASASPSGGASPYTYSWSNGTSAVSTGNPTGNVLSAGNYTVTIHDANDCSTTALVTTTQPAALVPSVTILSNAGCYGGSRGNASAAVSGGMSPYTYSWSNGTSAVSTANPTGTILSAGSYTVTVQDNNGCSATASTTITQPFLLGLKITAQTNISCNGASTGNITAIIQPDTISQAFSYEASVQHFMVPSGISSVIISLAGGQGGGNYTFSPQLGGNGASFTGICSVTSGHILSVAIGGAGGNGTSNWGGSGGGGTFVYDSSTITPLAIAAGGGGSGFYYGGISGGTDLVNNTAPNDVVGSGAGGTGGNGGAAGRLLSGSGNGAGGAGWISNGANGAGVSNAKGGNDRANNFAGGIGYPSDHGGYGGGGGNGSGGGGGGGYNGGGGGYDQGYSSGGGGGGSYLNGTVIGTPTNGQTGNGFATISYTLPGGTAPYTYSWVPTGGTNLNASGLSAGTYTLTLQDANGCSATASITITQPVALSATASVLNNVLCNGGNNGDATANASGGTSPYTYSWINSSALQVSTSNSTTPLLTAGSYTVSVTDICGASATALVTITQPATILVDGAPSLNSNVSCFGGNNGSATAAIPTGGTSPYLYQWNGGPPSANDTNSSLSAGSYTVIATDASGCSVYSSGSVTITQPLVPLADSTPTVNLNVSCYGGNNGSATVAIPTGGTPPYTYQWNGGTTSTNPTDDSLIANTYTVTITDANGCTTNSSGYITIGQPSQLIEGAPAFISNVSCYGGNNGASVAAVPTGGTSPYTYQWNGGTTSANDTNYSLTANTYTVTITDLNGCRINSSGTVTITQPVVLSVTAYVLNNITCNGNNNGNAMANVSGGTGAYAFSWVNSGLVQVSTSNPTGPVLESGSYTVTVTDSCGTSVTASVTITQTTAPIVQSAPALNSNVSCFGENNGSVTAATTGGTSPYTYQWNGGLPTNNDTMANLSAGVYAYTVTVTDINGCTASSYGSVTISQPAVLTESISDSTGGCFGGYGSATAATPTGGTSPYSYLWSNAGAATTANVTGLSTGTYSVSVTDANGCTASASVSIIQPTSALNITVNSQTNILCNGSTSSATASVNGGANPFTDLLDFNGGNGQQPGGSLVSSGNTLYGLATFGGSYGLGGIFSISTNGNVYNDLHDFIYTDGANPNGSLILSGTTLYGMTEGGGAYGAGCIFSIQTNGTRDTDLFDFNGVNGSDPLGSLIISGTTLYGMTWLGGANGDGCVFSIQTNGTGYIDLLDFNDTNGASPFGSLILSGNTLYGMATFGGAYNAGCVFSIQTNGSGYTDRLDFNGGNGANPEGSLTLLGSTLYGMAQGGGTHYDGCIFSLDTVGNTYTPLFSFNGSNGTYPAGSLSISGSTLYGMAQYGGVNGDGCVFSINTNGNSYTDLLDFNDTNGANPQGNIALSGNTLYGMTTNGGANSIGLIFNLNPSSYSYVWSPTGGTNKTASNLSAGAYTVTVTDVNGCTASAGTTITQANPLTLTMNTIYNIACYGGSGVVIANPATGGISPYNYVWSPGGGYSNVASGLSTGTYTLTVTDFNGCTASLSATITQPNPIVAHIVSQTNIYCSGGTGSATVTVSGGTSPYVYLWSDANSQTNITATGLSAGAYSVEVLDSNFCTTFAYVNIGFLTTAVYFTQENAVQNFTVPPGITTITITADGAQGGGTGIDGYYGGRGIHMVGACTVIPGDKISVVVGQQGFTSIDYDGGGGGGGTFVFDSNTGSLLMVAGGGGGEGYSPNLVHGGNGGNGGTDDINNTPTSSSEGCGVLVSGGNGGNRGNDVGGYAPGAGGSGWISNGDSVGGEVFGNPYGGPYECGGGQDRSNHFIGGAAITGQYNDINAGGFGGGGGGGGDGGGGGGGYNGGSGGNDDSIFYQGGGGGGGGSYLNGTILAGPSSNNFGNGFISIQYSSLPLAVTAGVNSGVSCFGESNGSVSVSPTGGASPYTYLWNDAKTTGTISNLSAGTYTVTVYDAGGCSATASITITEPTQFQYVSAGAVNNESCYGGSNGSVTCNPVGGNPPYTYTWSNASTTVSSSQTAVGLSAGTYTITVQDNCGAGRTSTATIIQPAPLRDSISAVTNITCNGGSGGSATVGAKGGTYPYLYTWSPGGSTLVSVSNLSAGSYTVTVTDQNGCTTTNANQVATITQPASIRDSVAGISYPMCYGQKGSITVGTKGGTPNYSYAWTSSLSTTSTATGVPAGTYTVTIKDAHRCSTQLVVTMTQPGAIRDSMVAAAKVNVSCNGGSNGSATVGVKYGTSPYTYHWTPNAGSTATVNGLSAGVYSVSVTDKNGCLSASASVTISQPMPLRDSAAILTGVGCHGGSGGEISIGTRGGAAPYTYAWSNGKTTYNMSGLSAGNYTVVVTDHNGCSNSTIETVTQPAQLLSTITDSCIGSSQGIVKITVNGGVTPYTYKWSNGKTTTTMTVSNGTYTVTVKDAHGCSETNSVTSNCPNTPSAPPGDEPQQQNPPGCCPSLKDVNLYPNPNTGQFTISGLDPGMTVDIFDYTGRKISTVTASDNTMRLNISEQPNGIYLIRIMDKDGTMVSQKKVIKTQ